MQPPTSAGLALVVDDDAPTRKLVVRWLEHAGLRCLEADNGEEALTTLRARSRDLDVVVLDVFLPRMNGFDVLAAAHADPELARVPIILLTAHADADADVVRGATLGAADHLTKPFSGPVLEAKVRRAVELRRSERELEQKLDAAERLARVDPLTQLGNRQLLLERLREEAAYARRNRAPLALAILDLDHFKQVNDQLGHEGGDEALRHFARLLSASIRAEDGAFRYGGEEFVVLMRGADTQAALAVTDRLRTALRLRPVRLENGTERFITFSAGVAVADASTDFATDRLLGRADEALYRAKEGGRNRDEVAGA